MIEVNSLSNLHDDKRHWSNTDRMIEGGTSMVTVWSFRASLSAFPLRKTRVKHMNNIILFHNTHTWNIFSGSNNRMRIYLKILWYVSPSNFNLRWIFTPALVRLSLCKKPSVCDHTVHLSSFTSLIWRIKDTYPTQCHTFPLSYFSCSLCCVVAKIKIVQYTILWRYSLVYCQLTKPGGYCSSPTWKDRRKWRGP